MRILLVNWQDRQNPQAGGAEIHLHEIFGRLASSGHSVSLLCGGWPGAPARASIDGISVHRVGTRHTFPFLVRAHYRRSLAGSHDVLVEDINKVPLQTPLWVRGPVVALVPHLFGSTAFREVSAPIASLVWLAERTLSAVYRSAPFQVISESTADDLVTRGIARARISVIYPGVDSVAATPDPSVRAAQPEIAYVGRLKRYKGVDILIRAFATLALPEAKLRIAGTGDYRDALERLASSLDLGDRVEFLGFISEEEKIRLLRRAWAVAFASPKEGWGITNLEAAACGTPVVASDSPGLRESVRDGETGFLVPHGDVGAMADRLRLLASSPALVATLGSAGRRFAESFSWERAASETEAHLAAVSNSKGAQ